MAMERIFITESKCTHEGNFFCTAVTETGTTIARHVMACSSICGFYMNFDPVWAGNIKEEKVPTDFRHDMWRLNTVALLSVPTMTREWREPSKLSTEGLKL